MKTSIRQTERKKYLEFLKALEVESIYLSECSAKFNPKGMNTSAKQIPVNGATRFGDPEITKHGFVVLATTKVRIGTNRDNQALIADLKATFTLEFNLHAPEEHLVAIKAFAKTNIKVIVWPYFREFVSNLTSRAAIPPFNMPI